MRKLLKENLGTLLFVVCFLGFRTAVADWSPVPTSSMEPTILPGDVVLINKTALGPAWPLFADSRIVPLAEPRRGDIITFHAPHEDKTYVKRVIGLPGDRIRTEGIRVYLNGEQLPLRQLDSGNDNILMAVESLSGVEHRIQVDVRRPIRELHKEVVVPEGHYFVMGDFRNNSEDSRFFGFLPQANVIGRTSRLLVSTAEQRSFLHTFGTSLD